MSENHNWRDKITAFTPNYITHKVNGVDVQFHPISVGMMFKLKEIGKPLAKSLSTLFAKNDKDQETSQRNVGEDSEVVISAISEGLAKIRHEQRVTAVEELMKSFTDENIDVIGQILMDSMRGIFPRNSEENPPPREFVQNLPAPALTAMIIGTAKANKDVLGPLADLVADKMEESVALIASKKQQDSEKDQEPTQTN